MTLYGVQPGETYTVEISPYPLNFDLQVPPFELLFQGKSVVLM